jgi:DNA-binding transcriptional regulator YiaG
MATELAPVTPEVLRWARESIGVSLDEAARRAGVPVQRVEAWETGQAEPTVAKLRSLARSSTSDPWPSSSCPSLR